MSDERQDILIVLDVKKDLAGRGARRRKGVQYTAAGQRVVSVWADPTHLDGIVAGQIEVAQSAAAQYLWHRREPLIERLEAGRLRA